MSVRGFLLDALELDDVRAASEHRKGLLTTPQETGKGARQHTAVDDHSAESPAHENQAVSDFDLRRLLNENNSFKIGGHFTRLPQTELSERSFVPPFPLSRPLTNDSVGSSLELSRVVFPSARNLGLRPLPNKTSAPFSTYAEIV
jgi:hypothetical protein